MPFTPVTASDPVAPLENILNTRFTELDNSITASVANYAIKTYKWANQAARNAQTGMTEGDIGDQLDTDQQWRYNGTTWVTASPSYCVLRKSANQNLTTTPAALSWDVEITDPMGMHDNVTNNTRITAVVAGLYEVTAQMLNNNATGLGVVEGRVNGTTPIIGSFTRRDGTSSATIPLLTTFPVVLAAGDWVEIMVSHSTNAGAITGGTGSANAVVSVKRIGTA